MTTVNSQVFNPTWTWKQREHWYYKTTYKGTCPGF